MSAKELLPFIVFVSILFVLVATAVAAYVLSSQQRAEIVRRRASFAAAAVWILIAFIVTALFAIPVLDDFRIPGTSPKQLALEGIVVGAICAGLWLVAVRRTSQAFQKPKSP